jgi:hypothetical protein
LLYQENYIESEELDYDEEVEVKGNKKKKKLELTTKHSFLIVTSKYK